MEAPQPHRDANGYRYRDENTVQDKRKIAILSYGSLVKQNANNQTGAKIGSNGICTNCHSIARKHWAAYRKAIA